MIRSIVNGHNLRKACRRVLSNKGSAGIDGLPADELSGYLDIPKEALLFTIDGTSEKDETTMKEQQAAFEKQREQTVQAVLTGNYQPKAILGVEIPKDNGHKRLLGIPTVTDRMRQQEEPDPTGCKPRSCLLMEPVTDGRMGCSTKPDFSNNDHPTSFSKTMGSIYA